MSSERKAIVKSLSKVIISGLAAWLGTWFLDDELRLAVVTLVTALLNSGYTWFDRSDPRFGPSKTSKVVTQASARKKTSARKLTKKK